MLKTILGAASALAISLAYAPQTSMAADAAPAPAAVQAAATAATVDADPALWVVKDGDTTVYLFGTVHVLKPGLSWFDEAVKDAFDKSGELVLEMRLPDPATAQAVVGKVAVSDQGTLTSRIPEDKRAAYVAALTGFNIPADALDSYDPWFAATQLTLISLMKAGFNPASGVEMSLSATAIAAKKPIVGLETLEEQFGLLDNLSGNAQLSLLDETVKQLPKAGEVLGKIVDNWAKGDPEALGALMNEGFKSSPETGKILLTDRNAQWAGWIEKRMAHPGTVFVAVGAGHLAGNDSVQDFLAKRNLKAERVAY
jgi:uncharacterized protein YbaP (TraB family)